MPDKKGINILKVINRKGTLLFYCNQNILFFSFLKGPKNYLILNLKGKITHNL